jgi:hypothetical protein
MQTFANTLTIVEEMNSPRELLVAVDDGWNVVREDTSRVSYLADVDIQDSTVVVT